MATQQNGNAGEDRTALEALGFDGKLRELGQYCPPLSLARAFGVSRDEVAHSSVLAELLDPARHAGAKKILGSLLREVIRRLELADDGERERETADGLKKLADHPFERIAVRRESMLIDVVVEVLGPAGEAVIGVENKIDAGEQPDQIARYQATLERAYPGKAAAIVFLTPTGREPLTASEDSVVATVALSYWWFADSLSAARRGAAAGRDRQVLLELEQHVREEILGEGKPGPEDLVRELWREHGKALRLAMEHRPRLADVRELYMTEIEARFPDASFELWGRRRDLKEIKMNLRSWDEAGFPFTFMLRAWGEERPQVRALLWKDDYGEYADTLINWARGVNASLGPDAEPLLDEGFTPLRRWTEWHRIFRLV